MATNDIKIRRARHDKENPYYIASRATAQDKTISYEALGVLNYVLSKPDDWSIQPSDLEREGCKRNRVYRLLNELIEHKYIERIYHRDDKGKILSVVYVAHENPHIAEPFPTKQEVDMQEMENPEVGNGYITEYREEQNTESIAPAAEKKSKANPIFDLVALNSFNLKSVNGNKEACARIGKIVSWLKKRNVDAPQLEKFYRWYDKQTDKSARPRDVGKFAEWFVQFDAIPVKPQIITLDINPDDYPRTSDFLPLDENGNYIQEGA